MDATAAFAGVVAIGPSTAADIPTVPLVFYLDLWTDQIPKTRNPKNTKNTKTQNQVPA
jgi:hypothetical protein